MRYKLYKSNGRYHCRIIRRRKLSTWWIRFNRRLDRDAEAFERRVDNFIINLYESILKKLGGDNQ